MSLFTKMPRPVVPCACPACGKSAVVKRRSSREKLGWDQWSKPEVYYVCVCSAKTCRYPMQGSGKTRRIAMTKWNATAVKYLKRHADDEPGVTTIHHSMVGPKRCPECNGAMHEFAHDGVSGRACAGCGYSEDD